MKNSVLNHSFLEEIFAIHQKVYRICKKYSILEVPDRSYALYSEITNLSYFPIWKSWYSERSYLSLSIEIEEELKKVNIDERTV